MQFVETARTFENGKLSVERRPATTPEEVRDAKRRGVSRDAELNLTPVSKQGFKAYVECRLAKPGSVYDFDTQSIVTDAESLASYQQAVADAASCGEQDSSDDLAEVDEQDEVLVEFVRWQHLLNFTLLAELKIGSDEFEETIGWLIPREDLANLAQRGGLSWAEAKDETVRDLIGIAASQAFKSDSSDGNRGVPPNPESLTREAICELVETVLIGQPFLLARFKFLARRKHASRFDTIREQQNCWRTQGASVARGLKALQSALNEIDGAPSLTVSMKNKTAILVWPV